MPWERSRRHARAVRVPGVSRAGTGAGVPRSTRGTEARPRATQPKRRAASAARQAPPGAHTWLEIPVPFPNTAVKQPGPMIVPSAKVGQCRVNPPAVQSRQRGWTAVLCTVRFDGARRCGPGRCGSGVWWEERVLVVNRTNVWLDPGHATYPGRCDPRPRARIRA